MTSPQPPTGISILGSTGSIGRQALEVVEHLNSFGGEGIPRPTGGRFRVVALAAQSTVA